jgi:hypothetical protein
MAADAARRRRAASAADAGLMGMPDGKNLVLTVS